MNRLLNLNADLGESFGPWSMGSDAEMLGIVGSANVACGYHAGDPAVMLKTVALARDNGVSVGAHPGFPDLQGFGRRRMDIPADELEAMLIYQIGALEGLARAAGTRAPLPPTKNLHRRRRNKLGHQHAREPERHVRQKGTRLGRH